ncbi:MAG: inositol monophosphatase family protein, partial [Amylibacter sp.]
MPDLKLLLDAAEAAGDIALKYFQHDVDVWDKADGQGPVTQADLEIDKMLYAELLGARPDYGWLSEETEDDLKRLEHETVFIVDPIDGTRSFINGHENFA